MDAGTRTTPRDIVAYYEQCEGDYRLIWDLDASLAMHLGYWDETTRGLRTALERLNDILASHARIRATDHVLDAGCGVGGSAIYLARRFGCRVTGISLSHKQVAAAIRNAQRLGVGHLTHFAVADFTRAGFATGAFDVVWALESVCYAQDKQAFVREASRVLARNGRLVLADGFATRSDYTEAERAILNRWLHNWAVPALETRHNFERYLRGAGFDPLTFTDITRHVWPSSRRLFLHSLYGLPLGKLAQLVGLRGPRQTGNIIGARYQHVATWLNLAVYGVLSAERGVAAASARGPTATASRAAAAHARS